MFSAQFIQETKSFQKDLHTVLNSISSLFAFNSLIIRPGLRPGCPFPFSNMSKCLHKNALLGTLNV